MKYLFGLVALPLLLPFAASAQAPLACPSGTYQQGDHCIQPAPTPPVVVEQAPPPPVVVQQQPQCPYGTYYQAGVCVQPAPTYIPPPVIYANPWENVPFNQQPGWLGGGFAHPGVTQVPGGWVGPGGHFHPR